MVIPNPSKQAKLSIATTIQTPNPSCLSFAISSPPQSPKRKDQHVLVENGKWGQGIVEVLNEAKDAPSGPMCLDTRSWIFQLIVGSKILLDGLTTMSISFTTNEYPKWTRWD
ncbi:unnamed protein product [Dovyalis caffra]|uniref:Uncharacterized protein n=1 Tax=Dovyalis caffra TaxID=77055 RepID=A0AAV1QPS4_9ROSI|nr:unnamed protein product [Dovyalis caffra]